MIPVWNVTLPIMWLMESVKKFLPNKDVLKKTWMEIVNIVLTDSWWKTVYVIVTIQDVQFPIVFFVAIITSNNNAKCVRITSWCILMMIRVKPKPNVFMKMGELLDVKYLVLKMNESVYCVEWIIIFRKENVYTVLTTKSSWK